MEPASSRLPTGYSPDVLPLHERLDDVGFEVFCTALLNLHPVIPCQRGDRVVERRILAANRLAAGRTPQGGADVRAQVEGGEIWGLQCKCVQRFGPSEVDQAVRKLEEGFPHATAWVLITACELNELALRAVVDRPRWQAWGPSRLTSLVAGLRPMENAIDLVHRFFGDEWVRRLFRWSDQPLQSSEEFFATDLDENRQFHHRTPLIGGKEALLRLEAFAAEGAGRALILSAPGGQGKSRLLLEFARRADQQPDRPRIRFLNLRGDGLTETQADWLSRADDLVLVVDDAHRLNAALGEVAKVTSPLPRLRLVIATRPQAVETVRSQLHRNGYAERLEEPLHLPRWKPENLLELARQCLCPKHDIHAPQLTVLADRCPLLVILGAAQVRAGKFPEAMRNDASFRDRVFQGFIEDFLAGQPESSRTRLHRLMRVISFLSPTPRNEAFENRISEVLGCEPLEVADDLETLRSAGLTAENREGLRLYPDLLADAVLVDAFRERAGGTTRLARDVVGQFPITEFPALLRNVAQADWETRTGRGDQSSLFKAIWDRFKELLGQAAGSERTRLLNQWGTFAVFQPELTLELVRAVLAATERNQRTSPSTSNQSAAVSAEWKQTLEALPPLLEAVATWHPDHAAAALDLLWSLPIGPDPGRHDSASDPVTAIARAASFAVEKPITASESVLRWLETTLPSPGGRERIREHPWILSALLSPFFGRVVDHQWATGTKLHFSAYPVPVARTRPLRQRALRLLECLANSPDPTLNHAATPVLEEAVGPVPPRFRFEPPTELIAEWRPDRLEALAVIERMIRITGQSHRILLRLRKVLLDQAQYDPDPDFSVMCRNAFDQIPATFELRLARALTEWSDDAPNFTVDSESGSDARQALDRWSGFCLEVAREASTRWPATADLLAGLAAEAAELLNLGFRIDGSELAHGLASLSREHCSSLLQFLRTNPDHGLVHLLLPVLQQAVSNAPEAYGRFVRELATVPGPRPLGVGLQFLAWKSRHGGGLTDDERRSLLEAAHRTEPTVVSIFAQTVWSHFTKDPALAVQILRRLRPVDETGTESFLRSLAVLTKESPAALESGLLSECLRNLDPRYLSRSVGTSDPLHQIAQRFPVAVYRHFKVLIEPQATSTTPVHASLVDSRLPSLGRIEDSDFVERELAEQWRKVIQDESCREAHLVLARALLASDPEHAPERGSRLIEDCTDAPEIELASRLCTAIAPRFAFTHPDLVRRLLTRADTLNALRPVREFLWNAATLGGSRSWTNGILNPEYRYIQEQAELLANRFRDDPMLGPFYRSIATAERAHNDSVRREHEARFADETA